MRKKRFFAEFIIERSEGLRMTSPARKQNAGLLVGSPSFADTAGRICLPVGRDSQEWKIIYLQVLSSLFIYFSTLLLAIFLLV